VLRRAQEVASGFGLPVMIHMGQTISPIPRLFDLLKRGDVVTHMFAPPPNSIVDESGHIQPAVLAARRRGVWFDVANGQNGHLRWDSVETIMKTGFWPDTFSTDWNTNSRQTGVVDFPNCMSKLFGYGMTVGEAVARRPSTRRASSRRSTTAARSTWVRRPTWRSSSCATGPSSSSTTTRTRSRDAEALPERNRARREAHRADLTWPAGATPPRIRSSTFGATR